MITAEEARGLLYSPKEVLIAIEQNIKESAKLGVRYAYHIISTEVAETVIQILVENGFTVELYSEEANDYIITW